MSSDLGGNQRGRNRALERLKANGLGEVLNQLFLFFFLTKLQTTLPAAQTQPLLEEPPRP